MICKFCINREANKTNTHIPTDSIIRTCLNEGGSNERDKGASFDLSNTEKDVDFDFQRRPSIEAIENALEREATGEEIDRFEKHPKIDTLLTAVKTTKDLQFLVSLLISTVGPTGLFA